jgi:hypothetical protein
MWQSIETYDGTFGVMLYLDGQMMVGGRDGYGWYVCGDGTQFHDYMEPTHWRHRPEPPPD